MGGARRSLWRWLAPPCPGSQTRTPPCIRGSPPLLRRFPCRSRPLLTRGHSQKFASFAVLLSFCLQRSAGRDLLVEIFGGLQSFVHHRSAVHNCAFGDSFHC